MLGVCLDPACTCKDEYEYRLREAKAIARRLAGAPLTRLETRIALKTEEVIIWGFWLQECSIVAILTLHLMRGSNG